MATLAGCSSSAKKAAPHSGPRTAVGTDVARGVSDAAPAEITTAYLRFFDPTVAEAQKLALIQGGAAFSQTLTEQSRTALGRTGSAQVTKVTVTSARRATVIFTLTLNGAPARLNQTGYAVRENGAWKVAGATFCALVATQGAVPPVCSTAPATALPG